jgi:hypothetical protein
LLMSYVYVLCAAPVVAPSPRSLRAPVSICLLHTSPRQRLNAVCGLLLTAAAGRVTPPSSVLGTSSGRFPAGTSSQSGPKSTTPKASSQPQPQQQASGTGSLSGAKYATTIAAGSSSAAAVSAGRCTPGFISETMIAAQWGCGCVSAGPSSLVLARAASINNATVAASSVGTAGPSSTSPTAVFLPRNESKADGGNGAGAETRQAGSSSSLVATDSYQLVVSSPRDAGACSAPFPVRQEVISLGLLRVSGASAASASSASLQQRSSSGSGAAVAAAI